MSIATLNRPSAASDEQQYRLLCAALFPFFLAAVTSRRIWRIGRLQAVGSSWSILAEARAASANALSFAFQG